MTRPRAGEEGNGALLSQWGRIQSAIARITGLSLATVGRDGRIISESNPAALCRLLNAAEKGSDLCRRFCGRYASQAREENAPLYFTCHAGLQCFSVPVRIDHSPVGAVIGGRFLERAPDISFFQGLARQAGTGEEEMMSAVGELTLDNVRTLHQAAELVVSTAESLFSSVYHRDQAQRRLSLLTTLFNLGTDLTPEQNPHEVYALILNTVSILFDVEGASLFLFDEETKEFRTVTAFGSAEGHAMGVTLTPERGLAARIAREHRPLITDDLHQILTSGFPEAVQRVALFPLLFGEEVQGILGLFNTAVDEEASRLIFSFCNQAALAIQNAQLRRKLRRRMLELSHLTQIHRRIDPLLNREALLQAIFDEATAMVEAEHASLMLLNEKTRDLQVALAKGDDAPVIRSVTLRPGEGIAGKVAQSGTPLLVRDLLTDDRFRRAKRPRYRSGSFVVVPLKLHDRVIGVLNLADKAADRAFSQEDLDYLLSLTSQTSVALQRSELFARNRELREISITDPLTRLLNRGYFQQRAAEEVQRSHRFGAPLSLVMLDVDDFKPLNDRYGHPQGDAVLVQISDVLRRTVRTIDVVSRYGGEEFAILSPQTGLEEAVLVAERAREAVAGVTFRADGIPGPVAITISAGVASFPEQAGSVQDLVNNADRALYRAKSAGKNRVVRYAPA